MSRGELAARSSQPELQHRSGVSIASRPAAGPAGGGSLGREGGGGPLLGFAAVGSMPHRVVAPTAPGAVLGDGCTEGELRLGGRSPGHGTCGVWVLLEPGATRESCDGGIAFSSGS